MYICILESQHSLALETLPLKSGLFSGVFKVSLKLSTKDKVLFYYILF